MGTNDREMEWEDFRQFVRWHYQWPIAKESTKERLVGGQVQKHFARSSLSLKKYAKYVTCSFNFRTVAITDVCEWQPA
ncbi:MAG: hypothetical protein AMXMBFR59_40000 [Rhodanobacteraceae bacterium]